MARSWEGSKSPTTSKAGDVEAPEPDSPRSAAAAARPPMAVVFRDLHYSVSSGGRLRRRRRLHLLRGVSGYVRPEELLAALGPSGSG